MDSLGYGATIIGPKVGAFADLEKLGIVTTYRSFEDLPNLLENELKTNDSRHKKALQTFLEQNTWSKYADHVAHLLIQ